MMWRHEQRGTPPQRADRQSLDASHPGGSSWERYVALRSHDEVTATYRVHGQRAQENLAQPHDARLEQVHPYLRHPARKPETPPLNYYELLGVSPYAPAQDLERAYRQHVAVIHPDKFFDDPRRRELAQAKLKELNTAMEVLRDRVQRARYNARLRGNRPSPTPLASRMGAALRPEVT